MTKLIAGLRQHLDGFGPRVSVPTQYLTLGLLILVVLSIRLATIHSPSLEWTSWKEIDYIYISQSYAANGFNFFQPEVGWPAEPPRVTEMEFPVVPYATAFLYKVFGFNAYTARFVTLIAFLLLIVFLFRLVKREADPFTALLAACAAAAIPLYNPFGKLLFTEPLMIAMSVIALFYFAEWVEHEGRRNWILSLITISLTFALKLETLYLLLPIGWILVRKYRFEISKYKQAVILMALCLVLPILWYSYAYYLEITGAHVFGIFTGHNKSQTLTLMFDPRWYRIMAERIIYGILGGKYGTLLFLLGLGSALWMRKGGLFFAYLAAIGCYFLLVAEGNIDAPYRQMTIVPAASFFIAFSVASIIAAGCGLFDYISRRAFPVKPAPGALIAVGLLVIAFIPFRVRADIFSEDSPISRTRWEISREIVSLTDGKSKLIVIGEWTKHVGGFDLSPLLYFYSGRQGWTLTPPKWNLNEIELLRQRGATHVVVVPRMENEDVISQPPDSPETFVGEMRERFPLLYEDNGRLIFDLTLNRER